MLGQADIEAWMDDVVADIDARLVAFTRHCLERRVRLTARQQQLIQRHGERQDLTLDELIELHGLIANTRM